MFLIADDQAGNLKIYELFQGKLKLATIVWQRGTTSRISYGMKCTYDVNTSRLGIYDSNSGKIFIYNRIGRILFKLYKEIHCTGEVDEIQLSGDNVFISGYKTNNNNEAYDLYYVNTITDQTTFLIPYDRLALSESNSSFEEGESFSSSTGGPLDVHDNDLCFAKIWDLRVTRINVLSGEKLYFGNPTSKYVPIPSKEEIESFEGSSGTHWIYLQGYRYLVSKSLVTNLFIDSKHILVIYKTSSFIDGTLYFMLQFYTKNGRFLNEVPIPGQPDSRMWLDKRNSILYSLCGREDGYIILKYKISDQSIRLLD